MTSVDQLYNVLPKWAGVTHRTAERLQISATAQRPSGAVGRTYQLTIETPAENRVLVLEDQEHSILPRCCIERHINEDSTFCLQLGSTGPIENSSSALAWWASLSDFLNHQDYAERWHQWPIQAQLSHGQAAEIQMRMEGLATSLDWRDELLSSIFRGDGWLANDLPRLAADGRKLINARTPCPRGCRSLHHPFTKEACTRDKCVDGCRKQHPPILRVDCPQRATVEDLVCLEHSRRKIEREYVEYLLRKDITCCRTMRGCPLLQSRGPLNSDKLEG